MPGQEIIIGLLALTVLVLIVTLIRQQRPKAEEQYLQNDLAHLRQEVSDLNTNLNKTLTERMDRTQDSVRDQLRQSSTMSAAGWLSWMRLTGEWLAWRTS